MQSAAHTLPHRRRAGLGSLFKFFHQILSAKEESTIPKLNTPAAQTGPSGNEPKPKTILVVDDNLIILKTLAWKLKAAGYKVISAQDGGEGVSLARKERPDVI